MEPALARNAVTVSPMSPSGLARYATLSLIPGAALRMRQTRWFVPAGGCARIVSVSALTIIITGLNVSLCVIATESTPFPKRSAAEMESANGASPSPMGFACAVRAIAARNARLGPRRLSENTLSMFDGWLDGW